MSFELRKMFPEDGEKVLAIFGEGIESGNATFDQDIPSWEVWNINHLNCCRFVLENDQDEIVGWCALKPVSNRSCFHGVAEVSIYISKNYQGKGLGNYLLKKLILDSEENGYWTLQSGVFPENKASISLHQKNGFRSVGVRKNLGQMNGVWRDVLLMERRSSVVGI